MTVAYYLDESGTTGDLARSEDFAFAGQRIFVLAAVRVEDEAELEGVLTDLKRKYKIQGPELKAKNTATKPSAVVELVQYLSARRLPIFIEVVDKRFHIVANLVSHCLKFPDVSDPNMLRVALAEHLAETAPDELLGQYCRVCLTESGDDLRAFLERLCEFSTVGRDSLVSEGLYRFARRSRTEFAAAPDPRVFLPPPDEGKRGRMAWILPELTSLTGIYARLNRHHRGELADVLLIHDEHAQFDEILRQAKKAADELVENGIEMVLPNSDYRFRTHATLEFRRSVDTPGIQLADILAGFVRRYIDDSLAAGAPADVGRRGIFESLLRMTVPGDSIGINFVLAERDMRAMEIPF